MELAVLLLLNLAVLLLALRIPSVQRALLPLSKMFANRNKAMKTKQSIFPILRVKVPAYYKGLYFYNGEPQHVLEPGVYWLANLRLRARVHVMSTRDPWIEHPDLDVLVKSRLLEGQALVLDLKDHERGLVWVDGRFNRVLAPGLYALWNTQRDVRAEVLDAKRAQFVHDELAMILRSAPLRDRLFLEQHVPVQHAGVYFRNGDYVSTLPAGVYAFWHDVARVEVKMVPLSEQSLDVSGQDIITADKVTLRLNAVATYRVVDALKSVTATGDARQALYRQTQLALRAVVGARELDALLSQKDAVAEELAAVVRKRAADYGVEVVSLGIKDVILPGEMKDLLNKVTEAKKAAEAEFVKRREETASMRSQANTAKLLENNPTLMRLRELEILEKVAGQSKLNVVLGEKGLIERVMTLL